MAASPRTAGLALGVGQEQGRVREHGIMRYDVVEEQRVGQQGDYKAGEESPR